MTSPVSQGRLRRMSLPWGYLKRDSSKKLADRSQSTSSITQTSRLLALPLELQDRVFDFIAEPWSLAVIDPEIPNNKFDRDELPELRKMGSRLISGPPGFKVLLVCRAMYHNFSRRYGGAFTGKIVLGKMRSRVMRKLINYLTTQSPIRRFNDRVHTVSLAITMSINRVGLNLRSIFPKARYADCIVHEGSFGPLLQLHDNVAAFLAGRLDSKMIELARPTVNHTIGGSGIAIAAVHAHSLPWDDKEAAVTVSLLGTIQDKPGVMVGITFCWEGAAVKVLARIYRSRFILRFWEDGVESIGSIAWTVEDPDDNHIPKRFRWVNFRKW